MLYLFINQFTILKLKPEEEDEERNLLIIISVCNKTEVDHLILSPKKDWKLLWENMAALLLFDNQDI